MTELRNTDTHGEGQCGFLSGRLTRFDMYFKMTDQTVEQYVEDTGYSKKQSSKEETEYLKNKAGVSKKTRKSRREQ